MILQILINSFIKTYYLQKIINIIMKIHYFTKQLITLLIKTHYFINMINSLSKIEDFIKTHKFIIILQKC